MITQAELKNLFDYVDGQLVAKTNANKRKAGDVLGTVNDKGYLKGRVNQRLYRVHRLVFLYFHGFMPPQVDHIDGNRQNNQIENLREATSAQNNQNRVPTLPQDHHHTAEGEASMTKKMTPWFPVEIKPVHVGVYETDLGGYLGYSYWNGKYWSDTSYKLDMERVIKRRRGMQNKEWRGLL